MVKIYFMIDNTNINILTQPVISFLLTKIPLCVILYIESGNITEEYVMSIPNVSMSWCSRIAKCEWCEKDVEAGTPIVTVFYWNKGTESHRGFNVKKYYHPQCWVEQGLDYLKMNPYVPYLRKPKLELTPEQSKRRYQLLRHKAAVDQRIRKLGDGNLLALASLHEKITTIMLEIAEIGGIPKKWLI